MQHNYHDSKKISYLKAIPAIEKAVGIEQE